MAASIRVGKRHILIIFLRCLAVLGAAAIMSNNNAGGFGHRMELDASVGSSILVVDQNGAGDFSTVQAAVDQVPDGNTARVTIKINAGIYWEKVVVPITKPYITFQGDGRNTTLIVWHDTASDMGPNGQQLTAYNTASVMVFANNFIARDLSFQNTAPPPPPGVDGLQGAAFRASGDMAAFYNCAFYGGQDTLCDDYGRHYFKNCLVVGSIDFIFGDGRSVYSGCELQSIADTYGSVAAQDRQGPTEPTGFVFLNCRVTGTGPVYLGRAMGPYSRIMYANSFFEDIIDPRGWDDWDHDVTKDGTVAFGQYNCVGPGANNDGRVPWAHEMSDDEIRPYLSIDFIDGNEWLSDV